MKPLTDEEIDNLDDLYRHYKLSGYLNDHRKEQLLLLAQAHEANRLREERENKDAGWSGYSALLREAEAALGEPCQQS